MSTGLDGHEQARAGGPLMYVQSAGDCCDGLLRGCCNCESNQETQDQFGQLSSPIQFAVNAADRFQNITQKLQKEELGKKQSHCAQPAAVFGGKFECEPFKRRARHCGDRFEIFSCNFKVSL